MSQLVGNISTVGDANTVVDASRRVWLARMILGWIILAGLVISLFAISWDIQWHSAVGRDRTLTAPHLFILGGIALLGLTALVAVLLETRWVRRRPTLAQISTIFAGTFASSLGAYIVGFGALDAAIAFPIDQYWHTLYGVDVAIWAPFHIMGFGSLSVMALGAIYMLASTTHLAARDNARVATFVGYCGTMLALVMLMGSFSFVIMPALGNSGYLAPGNVVINLYPLLLGTFSAFTLLMALYVLPWRGALTGVAVVYILCGLIISQIVPPLMTLLVNIEQQSYRPGARMVSTVGIAWQYVLIAGALVLDLYVWLARRKGHPIGTGKTMWYVVTGGFMLSALVNPLYIQSIWRHSNPLMILLLSLLLGVVGILLGGWLGQGSGQLLQRLEK